MARKRQKTWIEEKMERQGVMENLHSGTNINTVLVAKGVPVEVTGRGELRLNTQYGIFTLSPFETVVWYALAFEVTSTLDLDLLWAYEDTQEKLKAAGLETSTDALLKAIKDLDSIAGIGGGNAVGINNAYYNLLCKTRIYCTTPEGAAQTPYTVELKEIECPIDFRHFPRKREVPVTNEEQLILDMLMHEHWTMPEITRNLAHGYPTTAIRGQIPNLAAMETIKEAAEKAKKEKDTKGKTKRKTKGKTKGKPEDEAKDTGGDIMFRTWDELNRQGTENTVATSETNDEDTGYTAEDHAVENAIAMLQGGSPEIEAGLEYYRDSVRGRLTSLMMQGLLVRHKIAIF